MGATIRARSRLFRTPAHPPGSGPDFVNGALAIDAPWAVNEAIAHLHAVEAHLGRRRRRRWEQRVIDLDLLAVEQTIRPDVATVRTWMAMPPDRQRNEAPKQLILPHPRMHERAFVLVPLADIAPDWTHPVLRRTVRQMLAALPEADKSAVVPLPERGK